MSIEEMHRCKQRKQYKLMLLSLEDLMKILPSATDNDKPRTKQTLLSEANQYIHYLQLCIHQLGKETGYCDNKILEVLHWDSPCEKPCKCLDSLGLGSQQTVPTCMENRSDIPPEQDATVRRSGGLRRIAPGTSGQQLQNRSSTPSKLFKKRKSQMPKTGSESNVSSYILETESSDCPWKFSPIRPLKRLKRNIENNLDKSSDDEQLSTPKNNSRLHHHQVQYVILSHPPVVTRGRSLRIHHNLRHITGQISFLIQFFCVRKFLGLNR
uniref:uncharacterized protein LOC120340141 isoform X2 n=1 Tax=Styela clava TaxID=7725 RepID=UPI00193A4CE8|nr:uncharacterized protein LOC120340141 isoform X2 [Styela clava]